MATITKTAASTIECPGKLLDDINNDVNIIPLCQGVRVDDGINLTFTFSTALSGAEDAQLDVLILALVCETVTVSTTIDQITGSIFPVMFSYGSKTSNRWLSHPGDKSIPSDATHAIMPFDCKLVGIVFSNEESGIDTDVEIHAAPAGAGKVNTVVLSWPLRNVRESRKTNFPVEILFSAGDKIGIFCKYANFTPDAEKPEHVAVVLYLQISTINNEEQSENFSGEF